MKKQRALTLCPLFLLFTLISCVYAEEAPFFDQFLGSPLLVLVAIIIIDVVAFVYHKLKK